MGTEPCTQAVYDSWLPARNLAFDENWSDDGDGMTFVHYRPEREPIPGVERSIASVYPSAREEYRESEECTRYWDKLLSSDTHVDADYWYAMRRWSGPARVEPQPSVAAQAGAAWQALFETCGGRYSTQTETSDEPRERRDAQRPSRAPEADEMTR